MLAVSLKKRIRLRERVASAGAFVELLHGHGKAGVIMDRNVLVDHDAG